MKLISLAKMRLIIIRHGETEANIAGILQGQTDGELTENGIEQAKKLGLRFKETKIEQVYSSDLQRAIDTANEILKYHPNLTLIQDKRIRERDFDRFEGKPFQEDWDWDNLPEGVENNGEMMDRAKNFIDDIYSKHKGKTVLVVCHGGMKAALFNVINNKTPEEYEDYVIKNTAVSIFNIEEDGNHKIHLLNCVDHLDSK